eukprot:gene10428-12333_t
MCPSNSANLACVGAEVKLPPELKGAFRELSKCPDFEFYTEGRSENMIRLRAGKPDMPEASRINSPRSEENGDEIDQYKESLFGYLRQEEYTYCHDVGTIIKRPQGIKGYQSVAERGLSHQVNGVESSPGCLDILIDEYVRPVSQVINFRTSVTGVTQKLVNSAAWTASQAQSEVLRIVHAEDILIGHSLNNDLKALKIQHQRVVDSSLLFTSQDAWTSLTRSPRLRDLVRALFAAEEGDGRGGHIQSAGIQVPRQVGCEDQSDVDLQREAAAFQGDDAAHDSVQDACWALRVVLGAVANVAQEGPNEPLLSDKKGQLLLTVAQNVASAEQAIQFTDAVPEPRHGWVAYTPQGAQQERYTQLLSRNGVPYVFGIGPAGTGKTLLATQAGAEALLYDPRVRRLVFTRPVLGVDEELGFLPGDINAKMAPWIAPVIDILEEIWTPSTVQTMLANKVVEIVPLAYMRGRTFKNSWIVADEMQNSTGQQMKMLLTRLGNGSRMVITGDLDQSDRHDIKTNGLLDVRSRLITKCETMRSNPELPELDSMTCLTDTADHMAEHFGLIEFDSDSVQRHPAVAEALKLYDNPV